MCSMVIPVILRLGSGGRDETIEPQRWLRSRMRSACRAELLDADDVARHAGLAQAAADEAHEAGGPADVRPLDALGELRELVGIDVGRDAVAVVLAGEGDER